MNQAQLAERRLAFMRFMCTPSQPSVSDAYHALKPKFPDVTERALVLDWNKRLKWMPIVLHLQDDFPAIDVLQSLRDIAKRAYNIYLINEFRAPVDHKVALEALRTAASAEAKAADFIAALKKTNVNFNQYNYNTVSQADSTGKIGVDDQGAARDSGIPIDEFEDTIRQAVDLQIAVASVRQSLDTAKSPTPQSSDGSGDNSDSNAVSSA